MTDLPTIVTKAGLQPRPPQELQAELNTLVAATNPGYTVNLPGSLIEDISSTDVGALTIIDAARVNSVNDLTPLGANEFLLAQLGQMLGVPLGVASNTSVLVTFSGTPGFVLGKGFLVSDGSYQYSLFDGGVIGADGQSPQLFALATQPGTWAVAINTVTQLVTSVPDTITVSVTNLDDGIPGTGDETATSYRARVLTANLAASQGMFRYLKTLLGKVSGVQTRLIGAQPQVGGGWKIIVGGGDPYQVVYAIYTALFDISTVVGSEMVITAITAALPAVVTTALNHGYSPGQVVVISDGAPSGYDGTYVVVTAPTLKTFSLGKAFAQRAITAATWSSGSGGQATLTTSGNHGITVGSTFTVANILPTGYNGTYVALSGTATNSIVYAKAVDPGSYVSGGTLLAGVALFNSAGIGAGTAGILTPNLRNITASIIDYPDTYAITYVNPPLQNVTMTVTWNTSSPNFVSAAAVAQLAAPAIAAYINSIAVTQPINILLMEDAFQAAIATLLPAEQLTRLEFAVSIDGTGASPDSGTKIIDGDPESFFFTTAAAINVVQG